MSKTKNVQNANSVPIKNEENLSYTNKVVKGAGTCEPMFGLILDIETSAEFGAILDLQERNVQIYHAAVATRPYTIV